MAKAQKARNTEGVTLTTVSDLTAGLDRRTEATLMAPNRSRQNRNARLSVPGKWGPRPGWLQWLQSTLGSNRIQGAARIYLNGIDPFTLVAQDGDVFKPADDGTPGSAVLTGLDATNVIFFPSDPVLVAVMDGVHVPKKSTNGTTWTQDGISAPAGAPTLAAVAGGSLVPGDTYEVSFGYESSPLAATSNEGPSATQGAFAGNLTVRVTVPKSTDPQVDLIDIYARDVTAGEEVRRFVGTVANPAGATTTYDITANTWSNAEEAPTTHNVPPALSWAVVWKNRWWAKDPSAPNRLRFSELFQNQVWPTLYYLDLPFTRGDALTMALPLGDTLVAFGTGKQGFLIIGNTSLDFDIRPSAGLEAGALGPRAGDLIEGGIAHAAAEGVYVFDGATDRLLSYDFDADWREAMSQSDEADLARVALSYHRRDKEMRVALPDIPLYGAAGEYILDLARTKIKDVPAWTTSDRALGGYVQWDGPEPIASNRGRLFSWRITTGLMDEESTGTSANGADLTALYEGPALHSSLNVDRYLQLYLEFRPAGGTLSVSVRVDGIDVLSQFVNIGANLAAYGSGIYGTSRYGSTARLMAPIELPLEAEGRSITVFLTYVGQDAFEYFTYGATADAEPEIRGFQ